MKDQQLIDLYWARDEQAIRETETAYGGLLHSFSMRILKDEQDSEECVNETLWKTWESIPPQRPTHFPAYILKICRFIAYGIVDRKTAQKRSATVITLSEELAACIPAPMEDMDIAEEKIGALIRHFLKDLPQEERNLFLKRYYYQEPMRQAAQKMGLTESNAKVRCYRIRKKLKAFLEKEGVNL